jgi:hypothetical protein
VNVSDIKEAISRFERERVIGEITVYLPEPPKDYKQIANWNLKQADQKFQYTEQPPRNRQPSDEFLQQEFNRFLNGYWFLNNGNLEFITGNHYFFLNYWQDTGKRMKFIDSQREVFLWWWQIERMPNVAGGNLVTNRRFGKALDVDTKIPTPDGWTTMGQLKEGDVVFDSKGKPTNVTFVTPFQYDRVCYNVKFSDGSSVIADAEHQWIAYKKESRACLHKHPSWAHPNVVTTEQIKNRLRVNKNGETCWSVLNASPIEYSKKDLLIPPYILGTWLGDGTSRSTHLTNIDEEIINSWREYAEDNDMIFSSYFYKTKCGTFKIKGKSGSGNGHTNHFLTGLTSYNLIQNKHIPQEYMESSIEDRLELLKGMMDTDGCTYSNGNCFEYCSKLPELAQGLKLLAESLGYKCVFATKLNKKYGTTYCYVRFGSTDVAPFKLKRKLAKVKIGQRAGGIRYDHRYIIDVVPVETRPVKCIQVDSPDSSYLCANYIVTHNTVLSTCVVYFRATTNPFHKCGIQSKTNKDGKEVFSKLVRSWQKLPEWLKPVDSGETRPASILEFTEPRKRSATKEKKVYNEVLDSSIEYQPSVDNAFDGYELNTVLEDEVGKTTETDTDVRWGVLKYCLLIGSKIVGKAFRTTTVEDMVKKGGDKFYATWKDSMMSTKTDETGRTNSMLTNLFIPADYGFKGENNAGEVFVDGYGISNRELATKYILATWSKLKDDKLKADQRKNPLTLKHAFQVSENTGTFDPEIYDYLSEQKEYLDGTSITGEVAPKNLRRQVTFYRDDQGLARWKDDDRGHASIVWDFADVKNTNARKIGEMNRWMPLNSEAFVAGVDPFAATIVTGPGSMGVLYIYRKGDPNDPDNSGLFVCRYAQRTRLKADFHKMVMIICQYYGCKANYESDVDDYYETFLQEGFKNYVMWRPKCTIDPTRKNVTIKYGTPSKDPFAFQKHFQVLVEYLLSRWHKIYFIELIDQLIAYDVEDRTKSDEVIAAGMALLGGFEGTTSLAKDTRSTKFLKFKNQQAQTRGIFNGTYADLSAYH